MGSTCHSPREAAVQPGPGTGQQCSVYLRVALPVAPRSSVYIWVPTSPAALRRCPAGTDLQPCPAEGTDPTSTFSGASRDNSGGRHGREGTKANIFSELELVSDDNCLHLKLNGGNFMGIHLCYIAFNSCSVLMHASLAAFAFCKNMLPEGGVGLGSCSSYLIFNITPCCEEYSQFHGNPDEWLHLPGVKCILGASFVPNVDKDQRNYSQDHSDFVSPWLLRPGKVQDPKGGLLLLPLCSSPLGWELGSTQTHWLALQCKDPGLCLPLTPEVTALSNALSPSCSVWPSMTQLHALLLVLKQSMKRRWSDLKWREKN